jgi:phage terminase large subunit-like protein
MNPDFENFRTSTWPELREWIPWNMVVPKHRYRQAESWEAARPFKIVFQNGAHMYCKGLKDPESARGSNLNWFWYDEGRRDPTGLGWKNAIAFCRVGNNPQAWCTTTPAHSLHWTSTFFEGDITDELRKILEGLGISDSSALFEIYQTGIERNKENLDPMFYASILAAYPSGYLRAREVDGRIADEEGALGDRTWFDGKIFEEYPDWIVKRVRFWDLAATEQKMTSKGKKNDPDETMGSLVGTEKESVSKLKKFCIEDQVGGRWLWRDIKKMVVQVARDDGAGVAICFEQEPGSGGKNQVAELKEEILKELPGHSVYSLEARKLGDRVLAANPWFGEAAEGQWFLMKGLWNEKFLEQLDLFPNPAVHDDRITSTTGARHYLAPIRSWRKMDFVSLGLNG